VASISLDGARAETHERIRGIDGHFASTLAAIRLLRRHGLVVQVNTMVMRDTLVELPAIARLVRESGAAIWELFFLVHVGRGHDAAALSAKENEDVCHFLVDAASHGFVVRTVEAPFFRRVVAERRAGAAPPASLLYRTLATCLEAELGPAGGAVRAQTKGTRDGSGILFVAQDGTISPSGFMPLPLGNVRRDDLVEVYREHPLLGRIRRAELGGACGTCAYATTCGGSRARAFAATADPLAADPGCVLAA
jgi:MoaA/NifB/PqqE/SkfB family radical SAM enzyme